MKKISIIGSAGSGKSTLAKQLELKTRIPAYHLDALYWQPGWVETEREKWRSIQENLCAQDEWILDGNYGATLDIRLNHSDTIIFLDINRYTCLARAIWRSVKSHGKTRPDMAKGCKEQLVDFKFAKWIFEYPNKSKPQILSRLEALPSDKEIIILRSPKAVRAFLKST
ncbi:DNA topology modulation protein [Chitinolyticbacter albus]|uniref:DNA topology modulation protein n=1 Tax=Chitinolyticbacter albus TaxID=2961951 RepID=UPI00210D0AA2|nr:DNA topology modulation protein [Chitinolyticbacter albus]